MAARRKVHTAAFRPRVAPAARTGIARSTGEMLGLPRSLLPDEPVGETAENLRPIRPTWARLVAGPRRGAIRPRPATGRVGAKHGVDQMFNRNMKVPGTKRLLDTSILLPE